MTTLQIPSLTTAQALLREAETHNPGAWVPHSINVGEAARRIAAHTPDLDPDAACIMGMLHDIGRRAGVADMRHVIDGYRYLHELGYEEAARITITHSFPVQDVHTMDANWDGTPADYTFIANYLDGLVYTDYDRLIQLCDALAISTGFCLIEKRIVDVALRRGINAWTLPKWQATFALQKHFEAQIGCSVYSLLPGVVETTFGTIA